MQEKVDPAMPSVHPVLSEARRHRGTVADAETVMIASDLDRTLIYSSSALQLAMVDELAPALVSVEILNGRPHSFMTLAASVALRALSELGNFVPITTRTVAQYRRVRFPGMAPSFAITSNGGNILVDGRPDKSWRFSTDSAIAECGATLAEVRHELEVHTEGGWAIKRRIGDDLFCYLVAEPTEVPEGFVPEWTQWCRDRAWRVSVQGRKIYAIPEPLSKERAMAAVASRIGANRVLAAGDGSLDAGFLAAADAGIRPPHGELAAMNWQHPGVEVAEQIGVLAADEILAWFGAQLGAAVGSPTPAPRTAR